MLLLWKDRQGGPIKVQAGNVGDSMAYICRLASGPQSARGEQGSGSNTPPHQSFELEDEQFNESSRTEEAGKAHVSLPAVESCVCLTRPHRLTMDYEKARLRAAGIPVEDGQSRLMGLAVVRSLGDRVFKEEYPKGVVAEPSVSEVVEVQPGEEALLVVGSDGLWDYLRWDLVMEVVVRAFLGQRASDDGLHEAAALGTGPGTQHSAIIRAMAGLVRKVEQLTTDDFSIGIVRIKP